MRWHIVRFTTPFPVVSVTEAYFGAEYLARDQMRELAQLGWVAEYWAVGDEVQFLPHVEPGDTGVLKT